jgi:hypothetical protein
MESSFIAALLPCLLPSWSWAIHPSCQFDHIYKNIFSNHPQLLEVHRMKLIRPLCSFHSYDLEYLGCTHQVFRPLCIFNGLLVNCLFPDGDSPLDFLADFRRAAALYEHSHHTAENAIIRWIRFLKKTMDETDYGWASEQEWASEKG